MEEEHCHDNADEPGFRVVIDVTSEQTGEDPKNPEKVTFLALASLTALPEQDIRAFDHEDTIVFSTGNTEGEAASAAAAVVSAWLSEAGLTTDRLWRIYGDRQEASIRKIRDF